MINTLLEHLDANRGSEGLYVRDRKKALSQIRGIFAEHYPDTPVTTRQILSRLDRLWGKHQRHSLAGKKANGRQTLCYYGREALGSECGRERLIQQDELRGAQGTTLIPVIAAPYVPSRNRPSILSTDANVGPKQVSEFSSSTVSESSFYGTAMQSEDSGCTEQWVLETESIAALVC